MNDLTKLPAWNALQQHYKKAKKLHLRDLFEKDSKRFEKFSIRFNDILLDYSKNRITDETMKTALAISPRSKGQKVD
jgi:glucose-6-phosphate isomerase